MSKSFRIFYFLLVIVVLVQPTVLEGQTIYVTSSDRIYRLDLAACSYELVVDINMSISDITFHPDGSLYGINVGGELFEIDTLTGNVNVLQDADVRFQAMTTSRDGIIFIADEDGGLWSYDKISDVLVFLGNVGFPYAGDLAFFKGKLYMSSYFDDLIIEIDLTNLANSSIAMTNAGSDGGAMYGIVTHALDCNDVHFYGIVSGNFIIYDVDIANQQLDTVCQLDRLFSGGATTREFKASAPLEIYDTTLVHPSCNQENGSIEIFAAGGTTPYAYSIDGLPPTDVAVFTNLSAGQHTIEIEDFKGCTTRIQVNLIEENPLLVETLIVAHETCNADNGSIQVLTYQPSGMEFSLDGIQFQSSNVFDSLNAGQYELTVRNTDGCIEQRTIIVPYIEPPSITSIDVTSTSCGGTNGEAVIIVPDGFVVDYYLDDQLPQEENVFMQLGAGFYSAHIIDQRGCMDSMDFQVMASADIFLDTVIIHPPSCDNPHGSIDIRVNALSSNIEYMLNGYSAQTNSLFDDLVAGSYEWTATDQYGCMVSGDVVVPTADDCGIYIPSIFSPNGDGFNDKFTIFANPTTVITKYYIFDRWGNLAYSATNFPITQDEKWWDGSNRKISASPGVFVYFIEVRHSSGNVQHFKGDITLIR